MLPPVYPPSPRQYLIPFSFFVACFSLALFSLRPLNHFDPILSSSLSIPLSSYTSSPLGLSARFPFVAYFIFFALPFLLLSQAGVVLLGN